MAITQRELQDVKSFFADAEYEKLFVELFDFQQKSTRDLIVDYRPLSKLIGFKGATEPGLRLYVVKINGDFRITIKQVLQSQKLDKGSIENYKLGLKKLHLILENSIEEETLPKLKGVTSSTNGKGKSLDEAFEKEVLEEEQTNANYIYRLVDNNIGQIESKLPYKTFNNYAVGIDWEDIDRVQFLKVHNQDLINDKTNLSLLKNAESLYVGHFKYDDLYEDCYIIDEPRFRTKNIGNVLLIQSDDEKYNRLLRNWRAPTKNSNILFSRHVTMRGTNVKKVDILYDSSHELYSSILDSFLRTALVQNKGKRGMQSIISTIQNKQDDIRTANVKSSFVVQGCAGSGKTMVLLHRLRYLLNNNLLKNSEISLLVPTENFKSFIIDLAKKFTINENRIFSFSKYYADLIDEKVNHWILDEAVFDSEYLGYVYSEKFLKEALSSFIGDTYNRLNKLIFACEEQLEKDINLRIEEYQVERKNREDKVINTIKSLVDNIPLDVEGVAGYDDIERFLSDFELAYNKAVEEQKRVLLESLEAQITPEKLEQKIGESFVLAQFKREIAIEQERIEKGPFFMRGAHERKMRALEEQYNAKINVIREQILEEEKKKLVEQSSLNATLGGLEKLDIDNIITEIKTDYSCSKTDIKRIIDRIENVHEDFSSQIAEIEKLINKSAEFNEQLAGISLDKSLYKQIEPYISFARKSYNMILLKSDNKNKKSLSLFAEKSERELYNQIFILLFNKCQKLLRDKFNIAICDQYKHYWYIRAYCKYLVYGAGDNHKSNYIFIDEAQDLSSMELDLINKYNVKSSSTTTYNIFGDINQCVNKHGIKSWKTIPFVKKTFELNENFRNTNQVVDFCNNVLPFKMEKVGVEMDDVTIYEKFKEFSVKYKPKSEDCAYIVKDEYAKDDLEKLLLSYGFSKFKVYTVKNAKGLEFNEIVVFDKDMTLNEKYIAYTRTLNKLTIVKELPVSLATKISKIIQGEGNFEEE